LAQLPESVDTRKGPIPNYFLNVSSFLEADSSSTVVEIQSKIDYDQLQFIYHEPFYEARYEITLAVLDQDKQLVTGKTIRCRVRVVNFEKTNSTTDFDIHTERIPLQPGEYVVNASLSDLEVGQESRNTLEVEVPDYFSFPFHISSLLFSEAALPDSFQWGDITYSVSGILNAANRPEVIFDVYNRDNAQEVPVRFRLLNEKDKQVRKQERHLKLEGVINHFHFPLDLKDLPTGIYKVELSLNEKSAKVRRFRSFKLHLPGMPVFSSGLDESVEQLRYIASTEEYKTMKKAPEEKKWELFQEFWRVRDPTPTTQNNEIMEEYYRRAAYVNKVFGKFTRGWITDRGRVYMILGPPDEVDRHPFEPDEDPYEVWYYNRVNRQFLFVDEQGFGEYHLITPHYDIMQGRD